MNDNQSSYRFFEQMMTILLFVAIGFFILYLVMAGIGAVAWKIIFAVLIFLLSGVCLFTLYTSQELLKTRSLWLTAAFCSLVLCTLVSLLCNYPAP
jgi:hypothetical protein